MTHPTKPEPSAQDEMPKPEYSWSADGMSYKGEGKTDHEALTRVAMSMAKPSAAPVEAAPVLDAAAIQGGDGFCETCLSFGEINGAPCPDCAVKQGDAYRARQAAAAAPVLGESVDGLPTMLELWEEIRDVISTAEDCAADQTPHGAKKRYAEAYQELDRMVRRLYMSVAALEAEAELGRKYKAIAWNSAQQAAQGQDGAVALKIHRGEICYKSDADDQSFGMWCPAQGNEFQEGTQFFIRPQPQVVAMTESQIQTLRQAIDISAATGADSTSDGLRAIIKAAEGEKL